VAGLSFGYRVRQAAGGAPRMLTDVDLLEISLVTVPMQPKARVHAVADSLQAPPPSSGAAISAGKSWASSRSSCIGRG
jgi:phage head maturation protease